MYRFMTELGDINKGTTQVGEVRRPLAAVSKITKANNIAFFSEGCDWILDRKDPITDGILKLVAKVKLKTRMYQHKGTYRIRAWIIPEGDDTGRAADLFGRQGR